MQSKNKIAAFVFLAIALFANTASAAITYSRSPSGSGDVGAPVTVTWSFDDISDFGVEHTGNAVYYVTLDDDFNPTYPAPSTCLDAATQKSGSWIIDSPDISFPDPVKGVLLVSFPAICETGDTPYYFEGDGMATGFTIIESTAPTPFELIASSDATAFLSAAATGLAQTAGTIWPLVAVAIGLSLAFFVLEFVIEIFKEKKRSRKK